MNSADTLTRLVSDGRSEVREDYAEILMDKIRQDRYPSRHLIERAIRLSS